MSTYLDDIVAFHRRAAENDPRSLDQALAALEIAPEVRDFVRALTAHSGRLSPSAGRAASPSSPR